MSDVYETHSEEAEYSDDAEYLDDVEHYETDDTYVYSGSDASDEHWEDEFDLLCNLHDKLREKQVELQLAQHELDDLAEIILSIRSREESQ